MFPRVRLRRNRSFSWSRNLIAEVNLSVSDLIYPIFIVEGINQKQEIKTLPDVYRLSIDLAIDEIKKARDLGIPAVALFPVIEQKLKNSSGDLSFDDNNLINRAVREIKDKIDEIGIICDVALDPYTDHGHDGLITSDNKIDNDLTVEILCKQSLSLAKAGVDFIAPSDMMDGRIMKIRDYLDSNNYQDTGIIAYSAKYASSFYGPFRNAVGSENLLKFGKETYQMDVRNAKEAMKEIEMDIQEGADMVIIKPGMPSLDIIRDASKKYHVPIIAYQVSGEYAMLKFASLHGALNWEKTIIESMVSFKRAGASAIFTYAAIEIAEMI